MQVRSLVTTSLRCSPRSYDNGQCCAIDDSDEAVCRASAPWFEGTNETWRYSLVVGDQVFGTVPKALYRAVVESFALSAVQSRIYELDPTDSEDSAIISNFRGPDTSVASLNTSPIDEFVPSMACPDCESLDSSFRSVPFSVTVTFKNAIEFRDWFVAGNPEQDCDWVAEEIETRISAGADDSDIEDYCTNLVGESNRLAKDRCEACGANLTSGQMFTRFESSEPRSVLFNNLIYSISTGSASSGVRTSSCMGR